MAVSGGCELWAWGVENDGLSALSENNVPVPDCAMLIM